MRTKTKRAPSPGFSAALVMAIFGLLLSVTLAWPTDIGVRATSTAPGSSVPGCWSVFLSPVTGIRNDELRGIAAASANDVWAVGATYSIYGKSRALTLYWDGTQWSAIPNPTGADTNSSLDKVAAISPNDVWAVGSYDVGTHVRALALHWDGTRWKIVPVPESGVLGSSLLDIDAISANDVWAVGVNALEPTGSRQGFTVHWNGIAWNMVPTQSLNQMDTLTGIAAVSTNDVWAVGTRYTNTFRPQILHWDGIQWTTVSTPELGTGGQLYGVTGIGQNEVWAVGTMGREAGTGAQTLIIRWDGAQWSMMPNPGANDPHGVNTLYAVGGGSARDVWAVGESLPERPWLEHWDGSTWSEVSAPSTVTILHLRSVVALPGGNVWIAGLSYGRGAKLNDGLVIRHTSTSCSTPTSTSSPSHTNYRTFPETGKTISDRFLSYWDQHGGLAQQGFPISEPLVEKSDLNGKTYTMQYFERTVFELHPENQPPYDVLLSQLGTLRYNSKYPGGAPNQQPNLRAGSVLFKETGKRIGGEFLEYWKSHGGLMQQGYPISEEFTETSDLDGRSYRVQYFERAVFEYHPENQPPYDILLSQLGSFQYRARYSPR